MTSLSNHIHYTYIYIHIPGALGKKKNYIDKLPCITLQIWGLQPMFFLQAQLWMNTQNIY